MINLLPTVRSLSNMLLEMNQKRLETKRITKTAVLLIFSGLSPNSIPLDITKRVVEEQKEDGGWVAVTDTVWNIKYLNLINKDKYDINIRNGKNFLLSQENKYSLWGRSKRDMSRIPVTGILFYLLPEFANLHRLDKFTKLWESEKNSIVYKAGYTLMVFKKSNFYPADKNLIQETCKWLSNNQREDGGFAPWITHPVDSDVFCTAIAALGLLQYRDYVLDSVFIKAHCWLIDNRLKSGIWKYHQVEDGASWGLYALAQLQKSGIL